MKVIVFFDSVAQGLRKLPLKEVKDISTKNLRTICRDFFAQEQHDDSAQKMKEELTKAIISDNEYNDKYDINKNTNNINEYITRIGFTADDIATKEFGAAGVLDLKEALWGRPDVEGRIICFHYKVQLHVRERHELNNEMVYTDDLITLNGSKSVDNELCYNDSNTVHIYNSGHQHFEPILPHNQQASDALPWDSSTCTQQQQSSLSFDTSAFIDEVSNRGLLGFQQNDAEHEQPLIGKLPGEPH